jgi:DeoR/GlpR family transcriptional regulator of sugar metabolism
MPTEQRRRLIADLVTREGSVSTEALAARFDVSAMTIWRDLTALGQEGKVEQVRGGALRLDVAPEVEPTYFRKQPLRWQEKESIARYAAHTFVENGDIIILEAGTTVAAMVKYLAQENLTLISNGMDTLNETMPLLHRMTVIGCGGMVRAPALTFVGPQAEQFFRQIRARTLFLGASGLAFPEGITDPNPLEIQVKQAMAASAERVVLMLDSSKFGVRSLATIVPLERIAVVVTDAAAPEESVARLRNMGIDVHLAV